MTQMGPTVGQGPAAEPERGLLVRCIEVHGKGEEHDPGH